eukprot:8273493-Alexandrium_andersonii.AAC.1
MGRFPRTAPALPSALRTPPGGLTPARPQLHAGGPGTQGQRASRKWQAARQRTPRLGCGRSTRA